MAFFVVQTKTGSEVLAAAMLEQHLGLATYLPEVTQRRRGRAGGSRCFPGICLWRASRPPLCAVRWMVSQGWCVRWR